jgi:hypothetical protein
VALDVQQSVVNATVGVCARIARIFFLASLYTDCSRFLMVFAHGTTYPDSTYAIYSSNPLPSMKLSGRVSLAIMLATKPVKRSFRAVVMLVLLMGVNHGGTGGRIPPEFTVGDANTGCPPRFLSYFKFPSVRHGFVIPHQISTQIYATGLAEHTRYGHRR